MRIGRDFGDATFARNYWKEVGKRSVALHTTQEAVDNFALAACATVSQNLIGMFTNTWKSPISNGAAQEAFQRWGQPIVLHPRLSFQVAEAGNLLLQWQTQENTSYQLQESSDLQTWSDSGPLIAGDASIRIVTNSISASTNRYFRLNLK
jgi:hypothetical protein